MKKSELIEALNALSPDEVVFFRHGDELLSLSSVTVNGSQDGDEPPIFATIMLAGGGDEHKAITAERTARRERIEREEAEEAERQREKAEDAKRKREEREEAAERAAAEKQAAEDERIGALVAAKVAEELAKRG